jgi:hypothetical protein
MSQGHVSPPTHLQGRNENHTLWLMRRIWDRLHRQNEHFMGVIVGQEGSGKSYTAIKIAELIDETFTHERVIFDVTELLKVLKDGKHEPGNFYVLDEAGVQLGRRTWQERGQVLTNQALQLIRSHNLGLLFTLPRLSELDSQAQGRLQAFLEMTEKVGGEFVAGKWKWMDPDRTDSTGKIYKKYPRRRQHGVVKRITRVSFTPPSDNITEPYEERKGEFQEEFYEKTIEELSDTDDSGDDESNESWTSSEIAEEIANNGIAKVVVKNRKTGDPRVEPELVREEYDIPYSKARTVKSKLESMLSTNELAQYV